MMSIINLLLSTVLQLDSAFASISCFTCNSVNGSDPHCEDPMSPAHVEYRENCMVPKEGHIGEFPAHFCLKMAGKSVLTGETLVSRSCVLEDMNSQCGVFKFQNTSMNGCIVTCDHDGCNRAIPGHRSSIYLLGSFLF